MLLRPHKCIFPGHSNSRSETWKKDTDVTLLFSGLSGEKALIYRPCPRFSFQAEVDARMWMQRDLAFIKKALSRALVGLPCMGIDYKAVLSLCWLQLCSTLAPRQCSWASAFHATSLPCWPGLEAHGSFPVGFFLGGGRCLLSLIQQIGPGMEK